MTIQKGEPWGAVAPTPHDVVMAATEEAAARSVRDGARFVWLTSGDLVRALGPITSHGRAAPSKPRIGEPCLQLPCDLLEVKLGDRDVVPAVSRVVVGSMFRPRWWLSAGGFVGDLNVAPRAHPNDGVADALEFVSPVTTRQIIQIRRRMRRGDHLPHPGLVMHRGPRVQWSATSNEPLPARSAARVYIDGKRYARFTSVHVTVRPDAWTLCVPQQLA